MYFSEDQMWTAEQLFAARDAAKLLSNEWMGKLLLGLSAANGSAFLTMMTQLASRSYPRWFVGISTLACTVFLVGLLASGTAISSGYQMYDLRGSELDAKLSLRDFDKAVGADKDQPDLKEFRDLMVKNMQNWRAPQFDSYSNIGRASNISAISFGIGILMMLVAIVLNSLFPIEPPVPKPSIPIQPAKEPT